MRPAWRSEGADDEQDEELVDDGIIDRHDARTVPPCVHYSISDYGSTLAPVLESLCNWGRNHMQCKNTRGAVGTRR